METNLLVSVVIPCFNHARYIEEAVRSVCSQNYRPIELIVINDGSTDGSLVILERLQEELGFRLIDQENQGLTRSVNTGFLNSTGEFFVPFDADDVMLPNRLELQVKYLLDNPAAGGCGANFVYINESGEKIPGAKPKKAGSYRFKDFFGETGVWLGAPTSIFRRRAIIEAGGYDLDNKIQDQPMELQVTYAGYTLGIIDDVVTLYRQHGENMSLNVKKNYSFYEMAIDKYKSEPGYVSAKRGLINSALKWAVTNDKRFARYLFSQLPFHSWNRKTFKRLRQYLIK